jgi:hypothetical protein
MILTDGDGDGNAKAHRADSVKPSGGRHRILSLHEIEEETENASDIKYLTPRDDIATEHSPQWTMHLSP